MPKFITGKKLEDAIADIIHDAREQLMIVSPYIKLDNYFKELFNSHANNYRLEITLIFGKNEDDISRSLSINDFDFFRNFHNITIIYIPNLHAKYYGNETKGVLSSINLYDYSFINNIEFGVLTENKSMLDMLKSNFDDDIWNYCCKLSEEHEVIFAKRPIVKKKLLGKDYVGSKVLFDVTEDVLEDVSYEEKRISEFPKYVTTDDDKSAKRPQRADFETKQHTNPKMGYCIRTGVEIPFNPAKPMSYEAYQVWIEFRNPDYRENFCHLTGKKSNGRTSMRNPIME